MCMDELSFKRLLWVAGKESVKVSELGGGEARNVAGAVRNFVTLG